MLGKCMVCRENELPNARAKYCSPACRQKAKRGFDVVSQTPGEEVSKPLEIEGIKNSKGGESETVTVNLEAMLKDMPEMTVDEEEMKALIIRTNAKLAASGLPLALTDKEVLKFVHTGIAELDELTKESDSENIGGLPRGRITEVFGPNRGGKSSLTKIIAQNNPEYKILFFDAEGGLIDPPANMVVIKASIVEDVGKAICKSLEDEEYDLIVVDSVASLVTHKQFADDPEGKAAMARALNPEVKRIVAHLGVGRNRAAMLFINQLRSTTNSFGAIEYTVGGNALPYFASLRLELRSSTADKMKKKINGKEMLVGQYVRCVVKKSRFGPVDATARYPMPYSVFKDAKEYYRERLKEITGNER